MTEPQNTAIDVAPITTTVPPPLYHATDRSAGTASAMQLNQSLRSRPDLRTKAKPWYYLNYHHMEPHRWIVPFSDKAFPAMPRILPSIFRVSFFVFAVVTVGNSWAMALQDGTFGQWWFYFGHLAYLGFILHLILATVYGLHHSVSPLVGKSPHFPTGCVLASVEYLEQTPDGTAIMSVYAKESFCKKPKGYLLFLHNLYSMTFTFHVLAVFMHWAFVATSGDAASHTWVAVSIHGLQTLFFVVDAVFFNQTPVYASHFFVSLFAGIFYVFWAWIGQSIFSNADGSSWSPYGFLDRNDPQAPTKYLWMIICFTLAYFSTWALHKVRDEIHHRIISAQSK